MTTEEQETIITQNRADDFVSIYTSNIHDLAYFRKTDGYTLTEEWTEDGEVVAASFTVPKQRANVRRVLKPKRAPMSEDQKAALAIRLNNARNAR